MTIEARATTQMSQQQLEATLWRAANALRGPVDPGDFKAYVFPVMFYKWICDTHAYHRRRAVEDFGADPQGGSVSRPEQRARLGVAAPAQAHRGPVRRQPPVDRRRRHRDQSSASWKARRERASSSVRFSRSSAEATAGATLVVGAQDGFVRGVTGVGL